MKNSAETKKYLKDREEDKIFSFHFGNGVYEIRQRGEYEPFLLIGAKELIHTKEIGQAFYILAQELRKARNLIQKYHDFVSKIKFINEEELNKNLREEEE